MSNKSEPKDSLTSPEQVSLTSSSSENLKPVDKELVEKKQTAKKDVKEVGGPKGLEPTRYGDWESKGRCYDF